MNGEHCQLPSSVGSNAAAQAAEVPVILGLEMCVLEVIIVEKKVKRFEWKNVACCSDKCEILGPSYVSSAFSSVLLMFLKPFISQLISSECL